MEKINLQKYSGDQLPLDSSKSESPLEVFLGNKDNVDSVIVSTILGHKDQRAKEFETIFKSMDEDPQSKAKIKEIFKARLTEEFEKNRNYYTKQAIVQAGSMAELFSIFDQFKENERGFVVIGQTEKEELKKKMRTAGEDIVRQVQTGELVNPSLSQISLILTSYDLPGKYNLANQFAKIIKQDLDSGTQKEVLTPFPILEEKRGEERPRKPKILERLTSFFRRRW